MTFFSANTGKTEHLVEKCEMGFSDVSSLCYNATAINAKYRVAGIRSLSNGR